MPPSLNGQLMAQLMTLVQLRRDEQRFRQAAEAMWSRIPKSYHCAHDRARLSPSFNLQHDNINMAAIAKYHGLTWAIKVHLSGGGGLPMHIMRHLPCTLDSVRLLMTVRASDETPTLDMWEAGALAANPRISRDLYDYMLAHGHRVHIFAHLVYCVDNLHLSPQEAVGDELDGLYTPIPFTELTDAQRQLLHDRSLTWNYITISATSPQQLWNCEKLRHLVHWDYVGTYYANPRFSIAHKLQTWAWLISLPKGALAASVPFWADLREEHKPQLTSYVWRILYAQPWIDYVDFIALPDDGDFASCPIVGAPLTWWKKQKPKDTREYRVQIAIERGLPGTVESLIQQLTTSDGMQVFRDALDSYHRVRACYRRRFVNAIARHWRSMIKHH